MQLPVGMVFSSTSSPSSSSSLPAAAEHALKKPRVASERSLPPDPQDMANSMMADPHLRHAVMYNLDTDSRRCAMTDLLSLMDDEEYAHFVAERIVPGVYFHRRP